MSNDAKMHIGLRLSCGSTDFEAAARLARKAEEHRLDAVFIDDPHLTGDQSGAAIPFEPTTLASALASATARIGIVAAASPNDHQPYNLARRFASLDIISGGRIGWNCVAAQPPGAELSRTGEFVDVVQGLWESWDADALLLDKQAGRFFEPARMHVLDHRGAHFSVRGPLNVARSLQGAPVTIMPAAGGDLMLAARTASLVLGAPDSLEQARRLRDDLRRRAASSGRPDDAVKLLVDAGKWPADRLADRFEEWFQAGACDGFTVAADGAEPDLLDRLVPELQRRGLFRTDYHGATLRAHLGLERDGRPA